MNSSFRDNFPRQVRYWTFHCSLNALPSFCLALFCLDLWRSPAGIIAMLAAIGTFILLYASLISLSPLEDDDHTLSRALRIGTRIRGWMSAGSLVVMPLGGILIVPDFWCGFVSAQVISAVMSGTIAGAGFESLAGGKGGFLSIYLTTLLEGFLLSGILVVISFFAVMVLQARERRRFYEEAAIR